MAGSYVKLFGSILTSSIWCEAQATRLVWITMLLLADAEGKVWGAVPGIARQAGVSLKAARLALEVLGRADPDSRTDDADGRRLITIPGGWQIVNARKYREMQADGSRKDLSAVRSEAGRKGAEARWSDGKMANDGNPSQTMPEVEGERENNRPSPPTRASERPPNPLVDRDALIRDGHRAITVIAAHENLDPTEVLAKASKYRSSSSVRLDTMSDDYLAHTVAALRSWERRVTGQKEPAPPKVADAGPARPTTAGEKTMAAVERFIARRKPDADRTGGVLEGADADRDGLPSAAGRSDARVLPRGSGERGGS